MFPFLVSDAEGEAEEGEGNMCLPSTRVGTAHTFCCFWRWLGPEVRVLVTICNLGRFNQLCISCFTAAEGEQRCCALITFVKLEWEIKHVYWFLLYLPNRKFSVWRFLTLPKLVSQKSFLFVFTTEDTRPKFKWVHKHTHEKLNWLKRILCLKLP